MTADTLGGVWTFALDLATGLQREGIAVGLATMGDSLRPWQRRPLRALKNVTLFESRYRLEWMDDAWHEVEQAGQWLLELEQRFKPDVVHLNQFTFGALPWKAPVVVTGHSCVYSWYRSVRAASPPPARWQRYRDAVTAGLSAAGLVTAPTRAMLGELNTFYGPFHAAEPIPNGRPTPVSPPQSDEPFILAAGRLWDDAKNIRGLASIAQRLSWPVYVAGESRSPSGDVSEFPGVTVLGFLTPEQLGNWMERASIYALPARYEPFGLTILEAALAGCALVLGDIPSLQETWHGAAVFVDPGDPMALESAIERLIQDPSHRRALAARARARASNCSVERMTRSYCELYARLLTPTPDPSCELFSSTIP